MDVTDDDAVDTLPLYVKPPVCEHCGAYGQFQGPYLRPTEDQVGTFEIWVCGDCNHPMVVELPEYWPTNLHRVN